MVEESRAEILRGFGAGEAEVAELLAYNENHFDLAPLAGPLVLPLPDEPALTFWAERAAEAREVGFAAALRPHLPQLSFPVRAGISQTESYKEATRRGRPVGEIPQATGLDLPREESIEIVLHETAAGRIPLLTVRHRPTFIVLLQALARRNEPEPVADSQGALMVAGFNNWSRVGELKRRWEASPPAGRASATWEEEFGRIQKRRELYQDRFILLSDGPYSGVPAGDLELDDGEWRDLSLILRREHESTHYLTRRLLGSMRNNARDELIADCAGISAASGRFRADWFLRFMEGRLALYRGDPPLSDGAFNILRKLLERAAHNVERFDREREREEGKMADRFLVAATLASCTLEELAAEGAPAVLGEIRGRLAQNVS
jgi:hypothetical protein